MVGVGEDSKNIIQYLTPDVSFTHLEPPTTTDGTFKPRDEDYPRLKTPGH